MIDVNYISASDFCDSVRDGTHDTPKQTNSGYKLVTSKHIKNGQINSDEGYYISEKDYHKINERSLVEQWDVLMSMIGTIGEAAIVKVQPDYAIKNVALFKCGVEQKAKWLYYYLCSSDGKGQLFGNQKGASQQFVSLTQLRNLRIPVLDNTSMIKTTEILSVYDDLIENYQKQIKLLEEAAMRLYREWFINLRFPGYKTTKMIGGVPEEWERVTVSKVLESYIGGGWGKENATGKNMYKGKVIRGTDINDIKNGDFFNVPERFHTDNDIIKRKLLAYDLVFELSNGNIDNIGRCLFIDDLVLSSCGENTICASFCKLLRPKDLKSAVVLYHEINDMQSSGRMSPLKKNGANGINNFDFDGFLAHEFLLPKNEKLITILHDIMLKVSNTQKQFYFLRIARDKLLPRLMSGEIEV